MKQQIFTLAVVAVMAVGLTTLFASQIAAAESTNKTTVSTQTQTAVGKQTQWLIDASKQLPITPESAAGHLSETLRTPEQLAKLNDTLTKMTATGQLKLETFRVTYERENTQGFGLIKPSNGIAWHGVFIASEDGILQYVDMQPLASSWDEFDRRLQATASNTAYTVSSVQNNKCTELHGNNGNVSQPIGSGFKAWVLGAVGQAVTDGKLSWDQKLAIRDDWKADTTSPFSLKPAGTEMPLSEYAKNMMYYSDNTATDHLLNLVGRQTVEAMQAKMGVRDAARNIPLFTTRELTIFKASSDYQTLINDYSALKTVDEKRAYLTNVIDKRSLPTTNWTEPRGIENIEWFASPQDMCRTYASLEHIIASDPANKVMADVLSLEGTTSLGLDQKTWPIGWFKGGSEPGVLSRSYYAKTATGQTFVVSIMVNDPNKSVNNSAAASELLTLGASAYQNVSYPKMTSSTRTE